MIKSLGFGVGMLAAILPLTASAEMLMTTPPGPPVSGTTPSRVPKAGPLNGEDVLIIEQKGANGNSSSVTLDTLKAFFGTGTPPDGGGGPPPVNPNAFYIAPNGKDTNAGTIDAPFATATKARTAMRASTTIKTTYYRAGSYAAKSFGGGCSSAQAMIALDQGVDDGEVWSYYPPDGIGTAIFDGGSSSSSTGLGHTFCVGAKNTMIDGFQIQNFREAGVWILGGAGAVASGNTIQNNIIHDIHMVPLSGLSAIKVAGNAPNNTIRKNYIYNVSDNAIGLHTDIGTGSGNISGNIMDSNFAYNTCTGAGDCGAYYVQDFYLPASTNITIRDNYTRDSHAAGGGRSIYLDDGASNVTVTGNVITGAQSWCAQTHGGKNNIFTGNICDLSSSGNAGILYHQATQFQGDFPMTGTVWSNNIVIAGSQGGGQGYGGDGTAPNPPVVRNNAYWNYVGSPINWNGHDGGATDSNPTKVDPKLSCWVYNIAAGSPVFGSPISFPQLKQSWGPTGFVVTKTGTPPSQPHNC